MPDAHSYAYKSFKASIEDDDEGRISAAVSVFHAVDSDGDVVLPTFWKQGETLPMVWSHDWERPIGIGTIDVQADKAVFNGTMFLDTIDGREAYTKMRHMADIQEFSFGYRVTDSEYGQKDGQRVRYLKAGERFEVSPVLVGANRATSLLSLKGAGQRPTKQYYPDLEAPEGSYEDLSADIAELFQQSDVFRAAHQNDSYCQAQTVATFPGGIAYVVVNDYCGEAEYFQVLYDVGADGEPTLTAIKPVEASVAFTPDPEQETGISYAGEAERALAALSRLAVRSKALAAVRAKEGRTFSAANVTRMQSIAQAVRDAADGLDALMGDAAPKPKDDGSKGQSPELTEAVRLAEIAMYERQMAVTLMELTV